MGCRPRQRQDAVDGVQAHPLPAIVIGGTRYLQGLSDACVELSQRDEDAAHGDGLYEDDDRAVRRVALVVCGAISCEPTHGGEMGDPFPCNRSCVACRNIARAVLLDERLRAQEALVPPEPPVPVVFAKPPTAWK